jgi:hypothetical protein
MRFAPYGSVIVLSAQTIVGLHLPHAAGNAADSRG